MPRKVRVKTAEAVRPHMRVFIYHIGFETIPGKLVALTGAGRIRKNSMIFRLPFPIRTSEQLRDIEQKLSAKIEGNPEVIVTTVAFMEEMMTPLSDEQAKEMQEAIDAAKARVQAVQAMKDGVAAAVGAPEDLTPVDRDRSDDGEA